MACLILHADKQWLSYGSLYPYPDAIAADWSSSIVHGLGLIHQGRIIDLKCPVPREHPALNGKGCCCTCFCLFYWDKILLANGLLIVFLIFAFLAFLFLQNIQLLDGGSYPATNLYPEIHLIPQGQLRGKLHGYQVGSTIIGQHPAQH